MNRALLRIIVAVGLLSSPVAWAACSSADGKTKDQATSVATVSVSPVAAIEQPIARFIRVTGTLMAEEQADVAAETAGRVIATPVERGTRVAQGAELVRLSAVETEASLKEAEANAAQIEARLALQPNGSFDTNKVPEVANARANLALAEAEFGRIEKLLAERVVSQSEYDQRRTAVEAARQQLESAKNGAEQQYQALQAARARVTLARKAAADTVVRAPFAGLIAERLVSTGDYVTRGMKVVTVVRINPLRVELTVPEQYVSLVRAGQNLDLEVDAFPGRQFHGQVRFVSPALRTDQRALTVEAVVPNPDGSLRPGLFATANVQQSATDRALTVPSVAIRNLAGSLRVYVVKGDRVEERLVTAGQVIGQSTEIVNGVAEGDEVALNNVERLADGGRVRVTAAGGAQPATAPASRPRSR